MAGMFLLTLSSGSFSQGTFSPTSDSLYFIHGSIREAITGNPMVQAHIINLTLNRATLSDRYGSFVLEARDYDTLYLSFVGFKKRLIRFTHGMLDTASHLTLYMVEDTIVLKKYRVFAGTRLVTFRNDFISRPVVKDTLNPAFEAFIEENHFIAPNTSGIVLPGPVTLIYENFNKQARLKRKLERNRLEYYHNLSEEEKKKVLFIDE